MTRFVIGNDSLLFRKNDLVLLLQTCNYAINGPLEIFHADGVLVFTGRKQRSFITHGGYFSPSEAGSLSSQHFHVHIVIENEIPRMHTEYCRSFPPIRLVDDNLSVKSSRAHER